MARSSQEWVRPLILLTLLAGFALRLQELTLQNIWWDEARNIDVALRPFLQVATAPELDIHPPIYFWLLHVWGRISDLTAGGEPGQIAFLSRFVSVTAGVISIALLFQLGRRIGGDRAGLSAAIIGALSPFWVAESQETRMYTVGFAILTAAAVAFMQVLAVQKRKRPGQPRQTERLVRSFLHTNRYHIAFILLAAGALLTHYNALFIIVAWYLFWAVWTLFQRPRLPQILALLISGFITVLLVLPVAPIALRQIPGYANPNLVVPSPADYLQQNWQAYVGGYAFEPDLLFGYAGLWLWGVLFLVAGGLLLAGFMAFRSPLSEDGAERLAFVAAWVFGGLLLYYIAVLDRGAFNVRYSSFITPALYALFGVALAGLSRWGAALATIALLAIVIGQTPAVYADLYDRQHAREDIEGVTRWLREEAGPNDVVFVDQKYPFGFYYDRYAIEAEENPTGDEFAAARYLFVDINTIDQQLNRWAGNAEKVFWVQWFESDTDPRRSVSFLLDKAGRRAGERSFRGYSIDWWSLDPPSTFELAPRFESARYAWPPGVETVELSLPDDPIAAGETAFVVIRWQRTDSEPNLRPLKARVALYDSEDGRRVQADERILNDRHLMPSEWAADDQPLNVYKLHTEADLQPGIYRVALLVYDADTLEAVTLIDAAGNPAGIEATIGTLEVVESE